MWFHIITKQEKIVMDNKKLITKTILFLFTLKFGFAFGFTYSNFYELNKTCHQTWSIFEDIFNRSKISRVDFIQGYFQISTIVIQINFLKEITLIFWRRSIGNMRWIKSHMLQSSSRKKFKPIVSQTLSEIFVVQKSTSVKDESYQLCVQFR